MLQEFASIASSKLKYPPKDIAEILNSYRTFRFLPIETQHVQMALMTAETHQISFWDALIVEAAATTGCRILYTEDLNHSQIIRGVRVVNPFLLATPALGFLDRAELLLGRQDFVP